MLRRNRFFLATFAIVIVLALSGLAYVLLLARDEPKRESGSQATTPATSTPATDGKSEGGTNTNTTYPVLVYFSKHPESDNDPSRVFPVNRTSPDLGVGKYAVSELLKGPSAAEIAQGYFTTARLRPGESSCGGSDFTLDIKDGVATLQFCRQFDHVGVVADGQADSTLKATLKQFSTIQKVIILTSRGDCEFDLSGLNLCKQ